MLKKILISVTAGIALFLGYVALQPAEYQFQRQVTINAKPEVIFPYVANKRKMNSWNPFVKMDPQVKLSYEGPEDGVGATSSFEGEKIGTGRAVLTELVPNTLVRSSLEFKKPFEGNQIVEFRLEPQGNQTTVVWAISGRNNFLSKIVCTFMSMEKMMGEPFDKGLAELKSLAEAHPGKPTRLN